MRLIAGIMCLYVAILPLTVTGADAEKNYKDVFGAKEKKVSLTASTEDDAAFAAELLESAEMMADDKAFQVYVLQKAIAFGVKHREGIKPANKALGYLEILIAEKKQLLADLKVRIAEGQYKL